MMRTALVLTLATALLAGCAEQEMATSTRPSFVIISLDTLRADRVGARRGEESLTPNLDRLAAQSFVYSQAYAQSTETLFSHASLFSGRYPSELSTVDYHFSYPPSVPTMAEVLGLYGYQTGAAVSGGHLSPSFGLGKGFQYYEGPVEWGSLRHTVPAGMTWLDGLQAGPFLLFLHGYDAHARYLKPPPVGQLYMSEVPIGPGKALVQSTMGTAQVVGDVWHQRRRFDQLFPVDRLRPHTAEALASITPDPSAIRLQPADLTRIRQAYDGAATYADLQVGVLMAALEQRGLLETTWVIVLSDHGEELGERGLFDHRLGMSEALLHVPLIIRPPGGLDAAQIKAQPVGLIDVLPTVLEQAGVPAPAGIHGQSLLNSGQDQEPAPVHRAIFAEGPWRTIGAVDGTGGLVFSGISAHSAHLQKMLQRTPLSSEAFETWGSPDRDRLHQAMQAWRRKLSPHIPRPSADSEARRKILQERGYWGAP
jgi:hypothetical protein